MGDFYGVCALLAALMFFVLIQKFDKKFGKVEKELDEIKKRMDAFLKAQERIASDHVQSKENVSAEAVEDTCIPPHAANEIPVPKKELLRKEEQLEAPQGMMAENNVTSEIPVVTPSVRKQKKVNYEKFIGENLFGKIGILVFVIGVGFFVKYAIDKDWINETLRTVLGFLTGSALLVVAERLQKKYRTFSSLLAGGAFAVFYLTVAIAFHFYHLFPQTVAFIILIVITLFMSILSVLYDRRELAIISLVGGFLAPFIVSSGDGNYMVLFTYISILNLGMFGLSIYKKWGELPVIAFVFTYVVMGLFLLTGYSTGTAIISVHLFAFATLFYFIFLLPILSILRIEAIKKNRGLLLVIITNNFIYLLLGILFLRNMELAFKSEGLLSLFIAIINLVLVIWLRMSKKDYKFLIYAMLGLVLTFVSITIPIQLDGNYITLFWAAEMVLLLWLYVKSKIWIYERATLVLMGLTLISYLMDVSAVILSSSSSDTVFLNSSFATSLFVGLAAGAFALMMGHYRSLFSESRCLRYVPWNPVMLLTSAAILYYTFMAEFSLHLAGATRSGMMLVFTSAAILILSYAFKKRFPIEQCTIPYLAGLGVNVLIYAINIWGDQWAHMSLPPVLLRWLAAAFIIVNLYYVARQYYTIIGLKIHFTVYLNVLALLLWLTMARSFLWQAGVEDFDAGFSVSLSIAGFVQMALGMRLHQKVLRIISLSTFGIVLLKLILKDLWAMPTIGKIIVFIILGLILLVLSFLYQKLKGVLFKNDEDETD
ncbi:DUF2339 domain-containing protein [Bacteroides faecis]|uniref:DUF2339 domain-containing protein n=1 Tax=Bacteroides faecis TaxID=674529 RepID=UPI001D066FC1|nr:DUF2339 domain-containing protein [Bacteroides faecis]MCB6635642.1 DUF2339 domain-containing protein [Bacteroides faecis]MCE8939140.1 DUF2339 domain-containing protein [Bacteroides faecis]